MNRHASLGDQELSLLRYVTVTTRLRSARSPNSSARRKDWPARPF